MGRHSCVVSDSRGPQNIGAMDWQAQVVLPDKAGRLTSMAAPMELGARLSGGIHNLGAMALLIPLAVQLTGRLDVTQGQVLMPRAFGNILGSMATLVSTPQNLIVSGVRAKSGLGHLARVDFAPVYVAMTVAGIAFVALVGWRPVSARKAAATEEVDTGTDLTEARGPGKSKDVGLIPRAIQGEIEDSGA